MIEDVLRPHLASLEEIALADDRDGRHQGSAALRAEYSRLSQRERLLRWSQDASVASSGSRSRDQGGQVIMLSSPFVDDPSPDYVLRVMGDLPGNRATVRNLRMLAAADAPVPVPRVRLEAARGRIVVLDHLQGTPLREAPSRDALLGVIETYADVLQSWDDAGLSVQRRLAPFDQFARQRYAQVPLVLDDRAAAEVVRLHGPEIGAPLSALQAGLCHGDLHAGNVLVDQDALVGVLDPETLSRGGFLAYDVGTLMRKTPGGHDDVATVAAASRRTGGRFAVEDVYRVMVHHDLMAVPKYGTRLTARASDHAIVRASLEDSRRRLQVAQAQGIVSPGLAQAASDLYGSLEERLAPVPRVSVPVMTPEIGSSAGASVDDTAAHLRRSRLRRRAGLVTGAALIAVTLGGVVMSMASDYVAEARAEAASEQVAGNIDRDQILQRFETAYSVMKSDVASGEAPVYGWQALLELTEDSVRRDLHRAIMMTNRFMAREQRSGSVQPGTDDLLDVSLVPVNVLYLSSRDPVDARKNYVAGAARLDSLIERHGVERALLHFYASLVATRSSGDVAAGLVAGFAHTALHGGPWSYGDGGLYALAGRDPSQEEINEARAILRSAAR